MLEPMVAGYRSVRVLRRDSLGEVYHAIHDKTNNPICLRVIPPPKELNEAQWTGMRYRLISSLLALQQIGPQPGMEAVLGIGESQNSIWVSTEFLESATLEKRLADSPSLPVTESLELLRQIAETLDGAHQRDLRHGWLNPEQVIAMASGDIRITGFGLGIIPGSVPARYAAPERASYEPSVAADIFSYGILARKTLGPEQITSAVRRVLDRMVHEEPGSRYPSAGAAFLELRSALESASATAAPEAVVVPEGVAIPRGMEPAVPAAPVSPIAPATPFVPVVQNTAADAPAEETDAEETVRILPSRPAASVTPAEAQTPAVSSTFTVPTDPPIPSPKATEAEIPEEDTEQKTVPIFAVPRISSSAAPVAPSPVESAPVATEAKAPEPRPYTPVIAPPPPPVPAAPAEEESAPEEDDDVTVIMRPRKRDEASSTPRASVPQTPAPRAGGQQQVAPQQKASAPTDFSAMPGVREQQAKKRGAGMLILVVLLIAAAAAYYFLFMPK
ncbi:MAG: hypothetical protein OHK0029_21550 [Armatimonadaceae bacterium]